MISLVNSPPSSRLARPVPAANPNSLPSVVPRRFIMCPMMNLLGTTLGKEFGLAAGTGRARRLLGGEFTSEIILHEEEIRYHAEQRLSSQNNLGKEN